MAVSSPYGGKTQGNVAEDLLMVLPRTAEPLNLPTP